MQKTQMQGPGLWPVGIALGLGAVVIANIIMIRIAIQNPSAPAAEDHYAESLQWNEELEARAASTALGWTVHVDPCAEGRSPCALGVSVVDDAGQALPGLRVRAEARRHDDTRWDQALDLEATEPGRYAAPWVHPKAGLWSIRLQLEGPNGARWRGERELVFHATEQEREREQGGV